MSDQNSFGSDQNPWDSDPSKKPGPSQPTQPESAPSEPTQPEPIQHEPSNPVSPAQPVPPVSSTPAYPAIPVPPRPTTAPNVGTYYGNNQGYLVSGPSADGLSIASMVLGIISLLSVCLWFVASIVAIVSIVLGIVGLVRISKSNNQLSGKGFAISGIVCSGISLLATFIFTLFIIGLSEGWQY
jgi:hypothetical protein